MLSLAASRINALRPRPAFVCGQPIPGPHPKNNIGGGWGVMNGATADVRKPNILVLKTRRSWLSRATLGHVILSIETM